MADATIPGNSQDASLERLGINVQTVVPSSIMTSKEANAARFKKSRPIGYLQENVDEYRNLTTDTLSWYEQALLGRDQDVYRLGQELDRVETELIRRAQQAAVDAANAPFIEAVANANQDPEVEAIMRRSQQAERKIERTEARLAASNEENKKLKDRIRELEAEAGQNGTVVMAETAVVAVDPEAHDLLASENETLRAENETLQGNLSERDGQVSMLQADLEALNQYTLEQDQYIDQLLQLEGGTETDLPQADTAIDEEAPVQDPEFDSPQQQAWQPDDLGEPEDFQQTAEDAEQSVEEPEVSVPTEDEAYEEPAIQEFAEDFSQPVDEQSADHVEQDETQDSGGETSTVEGDYYPDGSPALYWSGIRLPQGLTPEDLQPNRLEG